MKTTTDTQKVGLIYKKIPAIMSKINPIPKDRDNDAQKYKFRGIDDVYNELHQHLANEGVFYTTRVLASKREERTSRNGGLLISTIMRLRFRFYAEDASFVTSVVIGEGMDSGDKSANKAMSTGLKYALMQIFCIPTEDPKDSENDSPAPLPKQALPVQKSSLKVNKVLMGYGDVLKAIKSEFDIEKAAKVFARGRAANLITESQYTQLLDRLEKKRVELTETD